MNPDSPENRGQQGRDVVVFDLDGIFGRRGLHRISDSDTLLSQTFTPEEAQAAVDDWLYER